MMRRVCDYVKKGPSRDSRKIYVICEGSRDEVLYFGFFQNMSSNLQVIPIPSENGSDPLKLMKLAEERFCSDSSEFELDYSQGDMVWFVIDTDSWQKEGKIKPLRDFCLRKNEEISKKGRSQKSYEVWNVVQSNPCFEIWLYYHVFAKRPNRKAVDKCASFKEFVSLSIKGGFNYQLHPIYLKDAIGNSRQNFKTDKEGGPDLYSTELHLLGDFIFGFVKTELAKLRNKLR